MFKHNCQKHGHRYEARYDRIGNGAKLNAELITTRQLESFMEAAKDKTYVRDICTRCGHTIERDAQ